MKRKPLPGRDCVALYSASPWIAAALTAAVAVFQKSPWSLDLAPSLPWTPAGVALAAVLAALAVRKYVRVQADPRIVVRRELLQALRALPGDGNWLNRDEHAIFAVQVNGPRMYRAVTVAQIDENDIQALISEGEACLVARSWQVWPDQPGIEHRVIGATATEADLDKGIIKFPSPGMLQWNKGRKAARKTGMLYASADEVRELITLLGNAEPMDWQEGTP